jgi:hypothetical protein
MTAEQATCGLNNRGGDSHMSNHLPIVANGTAMPVTRQARAIDGRSARGKVTARVYQRGRWT